jgi:DNA-directed RNA polymerase subunit RPC12/RpoP
MVHVTVNGVRYRVYEFACAQCGQPIKRGASRNSVVDIPRDAVVFECMAWKSDADNPMDWRCFRCTECGGTAVLKPEVQNPQWILDILPRLRT